MIPNINDLIADFVIEKNELDVDIGISSNNGVIFATGGQRVNADYISYGADYSNVTLEDMVAFIDSLIDLTPQGDDPYAKPNTSLEDITKARKGVVRAICIIPLESKNVRVDYQAVVDDLGVPELHVRLTAQDKQPPSIKGLEVVDISTSLESVTLNNLSGK